MLLRVLMMGVQRLRFIGLSVRKGQGTIMLYL